ncbi:hypothetical protein ACIPJN_29085 [Streptomyces sp. NPDC086796]|uniref:hypothetical protein n=1 Tax=Streptomyces sp. NPDC086796 TaxID=3365760 RepID=UPI0037F93ED0
MEDAAFEPPCVDPESDHRCCGICPALLLPRHRFAVADRPSAAWPFSERDGHRYTHDAIPVCVHPDRVNLAPDLIAPPRAPDPPAPTRTPRRPWWRRT